MEKYFHGEIVFKLVEWKDKVQTISSGNSRSNIYFIIYNIDKSKSNPSLEQSYSLVLLYEIPLLALSKNIDYASFIENIKFHFRTTIRFKTEPDLDKLTSMLFETAILQFIII